MTQTVRTAVSHILALLLIYWRKWQSENITISYLLVFPPQRHLQKIFEYLCVCPYLYLCVCPYFSFLRITYSCSISGASQRCSHGQWERRMYLYFKEDLHNIFIGETEMTKSWPRIILHWKKAVSCRVDVSELKQEMNEWLWQYLRYFCSPQISKEISKKCITITIGCHGHSQIYQDLLLCWHFQISLSETPSFWEKRRRS